MPTMPTMHALAAPTHANPYPYYASLRAGPPLLFDTELRLWIAARAAVVDEVLLNPLCRVRPLAEPVPQAIAGSAAGTLFGQLVRMNDGDPHARPKLALQRALAAVPLDTVQRYALEAAATLGVVPGASLAEALHAASHRLPSQVLARLLGLDAASWPQLTDWTADFVACLSPLGTPAQLAQASVAAQSLRSLFQQSPAPAHSLAARVQQEAEAIGWNQADALWANLVGLLSQTYDATAGLIGNSVVALQAQPGLRDALRAVPERMAALVQEVSRLDPAVQNTRRFVAEPTRVAGVQLAAGDTILLLLAAANRDPALHARPDALELDCAGYRNYGFGHGPHACPGQALASSIATAAVQALLPLLDNARLAWHYRPSLNARIPVFSTSKETP